VKKRQTRWVGFDDRVISLYARGLTVREIQGHLAEIYGTEVCPDLISKITDTVLQDAKAWQNRPLERVYPIVYLDALIVKVRDGHTVRNHACYVAIGVNLDGERDVLGLCFQQTEGAKFWLHVPDRHQDPRRGRHPVRVRRRSERLRGSDRGYIPRRHRPDLPGALCRLAGYADSIG
jgi:transposase-like protein